MIGRSNPPPPNPNYIDASLVQQKQATEACRIRKEINIIMLFAYPILLCSAKAALQRVNTGLLFIILSINSTKDDSIFSFVHNCSVFGKKTEGNLVLCLKFQSFCIT